MIDITHERPLAAAGTPLLGLGFRPFFLGASMFAVVGIIAWTVAYTFSLSPPLRSMSSFQWHAHEMIYGYSLAVIAGFLLTAVSNWTGIRTLHGAPLGALVGLWAAARLAMLFGDALIEAAAVLDLAFVAALGVAVARPIVRARQWRQAGVLVKLVLMGVGSACFYLGALGYLEPGLHWGVYGGLYLVLGLVLTIGRRVIPSFIEGGVGYPVKLFNARFLDISSLVLFLALFIVELFVPNQNALTGIAAALFVVNAARLVGWHTPGIWKKPLLWSLYVAYAFIVAGFLLLALSGFAGTSKFAAIHAFAYGGIGVVTLSMMVRVSLGHTGRDVHNPPRLAGIALLALSIGAACRVFLPVLLPGYYPVWIALSQLLWIGAFAVLVAVLFPMLTSPRVDGRPG